MRVVRHGLHRNDAVWGVRVDHLNGKALVVAEARALQLVDPDEPAGRDRVEIARDPEARPGDVDQERDAVGPADERVGVKGNVRAEEDGVVLVDEGLHERVVWEASLERAVREDYVPFGLVGHGSEFQIQRERGTKYKYRKIFLSDSAILILGWKKEGPKC